MINSWIILDNLMFGYSKNPNFTNCKKIYIFDLDNTIIKTKSGKTFPINMFDWEFLHPNVFEINNLYKDKNNIIGIVSNQKSLDNLEKKEDFKDKISNICSELNFHFVFVSTKDDNFRKPLPSSWEYIKTNFLQNINTDLMIKKNNIYYIGDAFGRENDFSDTDIKYAINCKFKFKPPEIFFKFNIDDKKNLEYYSNGSVSYPIINYFDNDKQKQIFDNIKKFIDTNSKVLIMMIGFPASGKTFLRKEIIKIYNSFYYTNNDDIIDKIDDPHLINLKKNSIPDYIIDDNTNLSIQVRSRLVDNYKDTHKILAIWFNYPKDVNKHLNYLRMFWFGKKAIGTVVYNKLAKDYSEPTTEEGLNSIITIDKLFNNFDFDSKVMYYF